MKAAWVWSGILVVSQSLLVGCARDFDLPEAPGPASLSGRVVVALPGRSDPVPARGATLQVLGTNVATTSGDDGRFVLGPIPDAEGRLLIRWQVDEQGHARRQRLLKLADLGVRPGAAVSAGDLRLAENATVSGTARRSDVATDGSGHRGIAVFVPEGPFTTYTGDDGSFLLEGVPAGPIRLTFYAAGYASMTLGPFDLREGESFVARTVHLLPVSEPSAEVLVRGVVHFDPPLEDASATEVVATTLGGDHPLPVGADGHYEGSLPEGLYTFRYTHEGYGTLRVDNVLVLASETGDALGLPDVLLARDQPAVDTEGPAPTSAPPQAVISSPTVAQVGAPFTLDGSASVSPDGHPLTFSWQQIDGDPLTLSRNDGPEAARVETVLPLEPGHFGFELHVRDLVSGASDSASLEIDTFQAPSLRITAPAAVEVGRRVVLDASGSVAPSGHPLSFAWRQSQGDAVVLSANDDASAVTTSFDAPARAQTLAFGLTVTDEVTSLSTRGSITIEVQAPPVARVQAPGVVATGQQVTLDASGSTVASGSALVYTWTQTAGPPVSLSANADVLAATPTFTAPDGPGLLTFDLVVEDVLTGLQDGASVAVVVAERPVARITPATLTLRTGEPVRLDGSASFDPTGAGLTYAWQVDGSDVSVLSSSLDGPVLDLQAGASPFTVTLVVSTSNLSSDPSVLSVPIDDTVVVDPSLVPPVSRVAALGASVVLTATATHPDPTETLTFTWTQTLGASVTTVIDDGTPGTSTLTFQAPTAADTLTFEVRVDGSSGGSAQASVVVDVQDLSPPVLVASDPAISGASGPWLAVSATFDEALDPASLDATTLWITDDTSGTPVPATITYEASTYTVRLIPSPPLSAGQPYTFHIGAVRDTSALGNLHSGTTLSFQPRYPRWSTSVSDLAVSVPPKPGVTVANGQVWVMGRRDQAGCSGVIPWALAPDGTGTLVTDSTVPARCTTGQTPSGRRGHHLGDMVIGQISAANNGVLLIRSGGAWDTDVSSPPFSINAAGGRIIGVTPDRGGLANLKFYTYDPAARTWNGGGFINKNPYYYSIPGPAVSVDPLGRDVVLACQDDNSGNRTVYGFRHENGVWINLGKLHNQLSHGNQRSRVVFVDGSMIGLFWLVQTSGAKVLRVSSYDDAAAAWQRGIATLSSDAGAFDAVTLGRQIYVAWVESGLVYLAYSADAGVSWVPVSGPSAAYLNTDPSCTTTEVELAPDDRGRVHVVFDELCASGTYSLTLQSLD